MSGTTTSVDCGACGQPARDRLSLVIVVTTLAGIAAISTGALVLTESTDEMIRYVFGSVLPLLGTWIGTVLAYYFTRENFQAASQETRLLVRAAVGEKLQKVMARDAMIPREKMVVYPDSWTVASDIKLVKLRDLIKDAVTRVPILDAQGKVRYIVHSSTLNAYISDQSVALAANNPPQALNLSTSTLADMLNDVDVKRKIADGMAFVAASGTLADASNRMQAKGVHCQDIFVTASGQQEEPVLGWITNVELSRHSNA
jgi:hypothetical protein